MKVFDILASGLLLLPGICARVIPTDEGNDPEPLPQRTRITAFTVTEDGKPEIQCWEIGDSFSSMRVSKRNGSSTGWASSTVLSSQGNLDHVSIETYPSHGRIYPPEPEKGGVNSDFVFIYRPCLFKVNSGLITITNNFYSAQDDDWEQPEYTYQLENGDDWFYFEDNTSYDDARASEDSSPPFTITSTSSRDTSLLRIANEERPKYKMLHKGACGWSGVTIPEDESSSHSSRIELNLNIQEL